MAVGALNRLTRDLSELARGTHRLSVVGVAKWRCFCPRGSSSTSPREFTCLHVCQRLEPPKHGRRSEMTQRSAFARLAALATFALALLVPPLGAVAQQKAMPVIGVLNTGS